MKKKVVLAVVVLAVLGVAAFFIHKDSREKQALREAQREKVFQISREDADRLVEEKLSASGKAAQYTSILEAEGSTFYLYTVTDEEGEEAGASGEMLAVDCVSGEVKLYLSGENKLAPYSEFSGYDASVDENIEWNGEYYSDSYVLTIEEQDPSSFEYSIAPLNVSPGAAGISEFAAKDNNIEASGSLDGITVNLSLKGAELYFRGMDGDTPYDGVYVRK